jgi:hypothetical protein
MTGHEDGPASRADPWPENAGSVQRAARGLRGASSRASAMSAARPSTTSRRCLARGVRAAPAAVPALGILDWGRVSRNNPRVDLGLVGKPCRERRARQLLLPWAVLLCASCDHEPLVLTTSRSPDGTYYAQGVDPAIMDFVHEVRVSKSDAPDEYGKVLRVSHLWWQSALDWRSPTHLHVTITCGQLDKCTARRDRYWFVTGKRSWGAVRVTFGLDPRLLANLDDHDAALLRRELALDAAGTTTP